MINHGHLALVRGLWVWRLRNVAFQEGWPLVREEKIKTFMFRLTLTSGLSRQGWPLIRVASQKGFHCIPLSRVVTSVYHFIIHTGILSWWWFSPFSILRPMYVNSAVIFLLFRSQFICLFSRKDRLSHVLPRLFTQFRARRHSMLKTRDLLISNLSIQQDCCEYFWVICLFNIILIVHNSDYGVLASICNVIMAMFFAKVECW